MTVLIEAVSKAQRALSASNRHHDRPELLRSRMSWTRGRAVFCVVLTPDSSAATGSMPSARARMVRRGEAAAEIGASPRVVGGRKCPLLGCGGIFADAGQSQASMPCTRVGKRGENDRRPIGGASNHAGSRVHRLPVGTSGAVTRGRMTGTGGVVSPDASRPSMASLPASRVCADRAVSDSETGSG